MSFFLENMGADRLDQAFQILGAKDLKGLVEMAPPYSQGKSSAMTSRRVVVTGMGGGIGGGREPPLASRGATAGPAPAR